MSWLLQKIIRQSNVTERSLVTTCRLLNASRSDDNPHGFTIEGFTIIETPWTMPANVAIALHPDFEYAWVECEGEILFMAKEMREAVGKVCKKDLSNCLLYTSYAAAAVFAGRHRYEFQIKK